MGFRFGGTQKNSLGNRSGFSVLSASMGAMILGISLMTFGQLFKAHLTQIGRLQSRGAVEDLRRFIRLAVDCKNTIARLPETCTSDYINILDPNGTTVMANVAPWKSVGNYRIRAKCRGNVTKIIDFYVQDTSGTEKLLFPNSLPFVCGAI